MIKHPEQRVAVFIDTQNMYYSARNLYGARVNFKNIVEDAVAGRKLTRAIAYVVSTRTGEEKPFFDALNGAGIETKEKELQIYGGMKKADKNLQFLFLGFNAGAVERVKKRRRN